MSLVDLMLKLASSTPMVGPAVNRAAIRHFTSSTPPRPRPFSLWSAAPAVDPCAPPAPLPPEYITDYTSWPGLTNKQYSGRHLGPADPTYIASLPQEVPYAPSGVPLGKVTSLFTRPGTMTPSRSSLLFMFFAQWFTDSVLRINFLDRRRTTSNHDIDLCQIYGLTEETVRLLRTGAGGRLRSQTINGEEYLEYLCEPAPGGTFDVRQCFANLLPKGVSLDAILSGVTPLKPNRRAKLYATGLERGNSTIGYAAISTIFAREHNRIAAQLQHDNPAWSDERLFQTARNINIVLLLKLVVEDYINHIVGHDLFKLDPDFAEDEKWYRPNWIALEFDLLYRWHGLAPDSIMVDGQSVEADRFRNNNALLESVGVGALIDAASRQPAGRIGLGNTPEYLWAAESQSIKMSRDFRLRPYNEYRTQFGLAPLRNFSELTGDPQLQAMLRKLYGSIDRLEFVVGLFAEEPDGGLLFGDLLTQMVAYDAFTQIFTNPLLSQNVYGPATFTDYGVQLIDETTSIEVLVNRNVTAPVRASLGVLPGL